MGGECATAKQTDRKADMRANREADDLTVDVMTAHRSYNAYQHIDLSPNSKQLAQLNKSVLVTGGAGFLGQSIVAFLLDIGCKVSIIDISIPPVDIRDQILFHMIDIGDNNAADQLEHCCKDVDTVLHVASLTNHKSDKKQLYKVNVQGTRNIITACQRAGVSQLIYTSTSSVVMDGSDLLGVNEERPYAYRFLDYYCRTKAEAETMVLEANNSMTATGTRLLTCSLRPHAMFGPHDSHFIAQLLQRARDGEMTHVIGDGKNLVDFTYVDNVVWGHYLAILRLTKDSPVCGGAYFITNGEPRPFWDFILGLLTRMGCVGPTKQLSFRIAYLLACLLELFQWLLRLLRVRYTPTITRFGVCWMSRSHYFDISKARQDLGYEPVISLQDGIRLTMESM